MKTAVNAGHQQRLFEMKSISAIHTALYDTSSVEINCSTNSSIPHFTEFLMSISEGNAVLVNQKFRMIKKISSN